MAQLLKQDGTNEQVKPANGKKFTLKEMQTYVGGYVQSIRLGTTSFMLMDEDGKMKGNARNEQATALLHKAGGSPADHVVGDVLMVAASEMD